MSFLKDYIKSRAVPLLCVITAAVIFEVVFSLYSLPTEPVLYSALLAVTAVLIMLAASFASAYKKHKALCRLKNDITLSLDNLPKPKTSDDKDYAALLDVLYSSRNELLQQNAEIIRSTNEYYTVWVHQIKTPIAAMRLMLQNSGGKDSLKLLEELLRIEQYVDMALCYIRLGSSDSDLVLREYGLDDIIKRAVRKYSTQFICKKLRLDYKPLSQSIFTDEKWLLFVIEQVLSNAVKYTQSGGISIYCETCGEKTLLCISDTGIGIDPADLPRIFENGYTGINGRQDMRASGLGLYLCRRICKMLGFSISAVSEVGCGTIIKLDITQGEIHTE